MNFIWPDLPQCMAVFTPLEFIFDENSLLNGSFETPQAMSLIPLFKTMTIACIPMAKFNYMRSEEHTSELQSLMRISYAVFCLKKKTTSHTSTTSHNIY